MRTSVRVMNRFTQSHRRSASHPFRQSLRFAVLRQQARNLAEPERIAGRFSMQDLREFLMAYCACFLAVSTFIA